MMLDAIDRAKILLKAVHDLLDKQNQTPFVLDMLSETVNYDDCECDGNCLLEDIEDWFSYYFDIEIDE